MTLFSLAAKNVRGNLKSYLLYFVSMSFSVLIYYTFVSLRYSSDIEKHVERWDGMRPVFTQASIILILFAGAFIWYANAFFTKKRKKEAGLYALLGMRKKTIGRMLFYENLIMGAGAVVIGIVVGTLLSKLFAMLFLKLLHAAVEADVSLSAAAVLNTVIVFAAIMLLTSLHSRRLIYRFRLVQLFQAEQRGEQPPKPSLYLALLAVIILAFGYWLVFQPMATGTQMARNMLLILISFTAGTYLLFRCAVIYALKLARKAKPRYYKGLNMFGTTQLLFRVQGNTRMFTVIALLSALTLSVVTIGASAYYTLTSVAEEESPFSYMHISQGPDFDGRIGGILHQDRNHPVTAELDVDVVPVTADLTKFFYHPTGYPDHATPIRLMSVSAYNAASEALGRSARLELSGSESVLVKPMYATFAESDVKGDAVSFAAGGPAVGPGSDEGTGTGAGSGPGASSVNDPYPHAGEGAGSKIADVASSKTADGAGSRTADGSGSGGRYSLTVTRLIEGRVLPLGFPDILFIVSDRLYADLRQDFAPVIYKAYRVKDQLTTEQTSDAVMKLGTAATGMSTFYDHYRIGLESAGMNIFILGFLGLVFLAATGCMLYFKQSTDAHEDRERYEILRKIGASRREIRATVAKQTLFVFALPLGLGIVHSVMIVRALIGIGLLGGNLLAPILISTSVYAVIYAVYYALCVRAASRIVL